MCKNVVVVGVAAAPIPSLAGLRVLEIAGEFGQYAGKLLADHGADVILVEPPGGGPTRRRPPFLDDIPGIERSLAFAYFNANKRGITLDLETSDGADLFKRLAADADVVIEAEPAERQEARRLDYASLAAINPRVVVTSISPFGRDGPAAGRAATDLTLLAAGGLLARGGYRAGAPVRAGGDQALLAADQFAAVGTMLAVIDAELTGTGQHVDVSAQAAVLMAHENAIQYFDLEGIVKTRDGERQRQAGIGVYRCGDGDVFLLVNGLGPFWPQFVAWLAEAGVDGVDELREERWQDDEYVKTDDAKARFEQVFGGFALSQTKIELYEQALRHDVPLTPVFTPADLAHSAHLRARGYLVPFRHPLVQADADMPGAPFQSSASMWGVRVPAPGLGADTAEVFGKIGVTADQLVGLRAAGVT